MRWVKSPSARDRDASVRRRSGVVKRWATAAATMIAMPSATTPTAASRLVTFAIVVWRNVYGFESVTSITYGSTLLGASSSTDGLGR